MNPINKRLLKAIAKAPRSIKTIAKTEIQHQAALLPVKAKLQVEKKLDSTMEQAIQEYKSIPQQMLHEFKRQSVHQGQQPLMDNRSYFQQYHYQPQQQRHTATPTANLAEVLYNQETASKRHSNTI